MAVFDRSMAAPDLCCRTVQHKMRTLAQEPAMKSALIVIDVQQSFAQRPYWRDEEVPAFILQIQKLIDRSAAGGVPVLQVFHEDESQGPTGAFSRHSGYVATLPPLRIAPAAVFFKTVHSAMFGRSPEGRTLEQWLRESDIGRVIVTGIRTEQCCETTARHASDLGFEVTYALDATLTFPMVAKSGRTYTTAELMERTELVLADRFAKVVRAAAVPL
jgi:nicotinamidase-related amidase